MLRKFIEISDVADLKKSIKKVVCTLNIGSLRKADIDVHLTIKWF